MKHKSVRNCTLPPTSSTDRKIKVRRVSEEALTWRRLHRVLPPCPGPAYLCWIPSPAAYRTVLALGWLQTNRQFWHLGLWSRCCSARSCLSRPCFVTTDPPEPTRPPHTSPEAAGVGGVIVSFGPRGPKSCLHPSAHFPHKDNRDYQGSGEVMTGTDPHQGERFRSPENRPQFSSCPQQGAPLQTHRRFSISSLPPGSCFPTTNYRLCCIYMSFHPAVIPLMCHSLRPSTEPDIY